MLTFALLILLQRNDLAELDALARNRDVKGLAQYCKPGLVESGAFDFLTKGGPYGTGRFGWHAYFLDDPVGGGKYVVFGTRITSQDIGEFVFSYQDGKIQSLVDEREGGGYAVAHYDFDLRFNLSEKSAQIKCDLTLNRSESADPCVHLRISPQYRVTSVVDENGSEIRFAQSSGIVSVEVAKFGKSLMTLYYSGVVDQPRYAGAITETEVMLTNDYWWPMVAREPATFTTTTHVPQSWTVVAQGKKTSDTVLGDERTIQYRMDIPVSYLSLSAGSFRHAERKVGRINYHVWSKKMSEADMAIQLELMPPIIEFYERFAPYPFEDFGAMVTDLYGGGALEAYSYATYGTGWLPDEDHHEPAHSWWGGMIANTYLNSFWNEGFAVFSGGLYEREVNIGNNKERREAFVQQFGVDESAYEVACSKAGVFSGGEASSLGYGKSGAVLQQLECEIGTQAMVASMNRWITYNPKGAAGEWEGFEQSVNQITGQDMGWFFDQWIHKPGAPNFEIKDVSWLNGSIIGVANFKGDPYRLTVDVYAEFPSGKTRMTKVLLNPNRKSGASEFSFTLAERPVLVSFDPLDRVFRERHAPPTLQLNEALSKMGVIADAQQKGYAKTFERFHRVLKIGEPVPIDLNNKFLIGHPDTMPAMKALCAKAGFTVKGNNLTYKGTTIDLSQGAAMAIVELGGGQRCAIGLGTTLRSPNVGNSRLCLVDNYGRFLRGITEPRKEGAFVFRKP